MTRRRRRTRKRKPFKNLMNAWEIKKNTPIFTCICSGKLFPSPLASNEGCCQIRSWTMAKTWQIKTKTGLVRIEDETKERRRKETWIEKLADDRYYYYTASTACSDCKKKVTRLTGASRTYIDGLQPDETFQNLRASKSADRCFWAP